MGLGKSCLLALVCLLFVTMAGHAACSDSAGCYGPGVGSDGLANTVVGGISGNIVSYRFRAGHTGSLQQIHVYLIQQHAGYSSGTGGQIQVTINADDGTPAHNPSSTVLASYLLSNPAAATPSIYFPVFVFSVPASLVSGQLYHVVFTDVDPSPTANYLSVDAFYYIVPPTPVQPTIADTDWAELMSGPNGTWSPRAGYTPILELDYQDGFSEGNGYMEGWVGAPENISGAAEVRETITVSPARETVSSASIRVARISGSDPLVVLLEASDGTVIEQGQISADSIPLTVPTSTVWATYTFAAPHTLVGGQTYHLQFSSAATSTFQVFPIRKGLAYGFQNTTYFPDGYAEFNPAGAWTGWTQWGVNNRTDGDLQFYFSLAPNNPLPVISNVAAGSLTTSAATITWTTDQLSTSQVEYGPSAAYGSINAVDSNSVTAHSETVGGLQPATLYHYRVYSTNATGGQTISGDSTFTTATPPPVITNVAAGSITASGATITWTTDEASSSQVAYGATAAYGSTTALNTSNVTGHSQVLSGLQPSTLYHYRVYSTNASGAQTISGDFTFSTIPPPPVISAASAVSITSNGANIAWITDQPSTSQVAYGTSTAYGNLTALNSTNVTAHSQPLSGLSASTLYHYRVYSTNASGEQTVSGDFTFMTLPLPPVISRVAAGSITTGSATIFWITDQPSSSQVAYGTTVAYGSTTTLNSNSVTAHTQNLSGLSASTLYHYRVYSTNSSGEQTVSGDFTFMTATSAPVISSVTAGSITSSGAAITWSTDQPSTSQIQYGTTTSYGKATTLNSSLVTKHSQALTALAAATHYHYRVVSTSASGKQTVSGDFTFTTQSRSR
ncbi:MAG TPA: fibronectin type III domain-containing protein [Bryobacteraceae bacterium]|nr:fibronectin type III domain-containing protein [Bryobacteraceae bacterium]